MLPEYKLIELLNEYRDTLSVDFVDEIEIIVANSRRTDRDYYATLALVYEELFKLRFVLITPKDRSQRPFFLSQRPITEEQWKVIMDMMPDRFIEPVDEPIRDLTWAEAQYFIRELNQRTFRGYRFPTKQEWKLAMATQADWEDLDVDCHMITGMVPAADLQQGLRLCRTA